MKELRKIVIEWEIRVSLEVSVVERKDSSKTIYTFAIDRARSYVWKPILLSTDCKLIYSRLQIKDWRWSLIETRIPPAKSTQRQYGDSCLITYLRIPCTWAPSRHDYPKSWLISPWSSNHFPNIIQDNFIR